VINKALLIIMSSSVSL